MTAAEEDDGAGGPSRWAEWVRTTLLDDERPDSAAAMRSALAFYRSRYGALAAAPPRAPSAAPE
eukprot:SAG11_NODE_7139_length_1188_cov_1.181818_2_plen_63_part_01